MDRPRRAAAVTRAQRILAALLLAELVGAGILLGARSRRPRPPVPDLSRLETSTAQELRRLAEQTPDAADEWRVLAEAYLAYGFFPEAERCFDRAIELDPASLPSLTGRAICLERMGRTGEAIAQLERLMGLADPKTATWARTHIGMDFLRQEQAAEADRAFGEASGHPPAAYQRARLRLRSGRAREALGQADELLAGAPGEIRLLQLRARTQEALGDAAGAAESRRRLERARARLVVHDINDLLDPIRARYGYWRQEDEIHGLVRAERWAEAVERTREVLRDHQPWAVARLLGLAATLELDRGNADRALALLEDHFAWASPSPKALELRGDALLARGRAEEGIATWERAARMLSGADVHAKLARAYERRGDAAAARRHRAAAARDAGIAAYRRDELPRARAALAESVEIEPQDADAWFWLSEVHQAEGDAARAREAAERCLLIDPEHPRAR
jgi:tetratricopeptide (TPR) repeat protein